MASELERLARAFEGSDDPSSDTLEGVRDLLRAMANSSPEIVAAAAVVIYDACLRNPVVPRRLTLGERAAAKTMALEKADRVAQDVIDAFVRASLGEEG